VKCFPTEVLDARYEAFTVMKIQVMVCILKMAAIRSSKMVVSYYITTWDHNPKDHE
jgi:hypothetical protein